MISIIIPVYNAEKYLPKCIDSILQQTYQDFELILVDDGSTDNSLSVCEKYAERDKRIRVLHKQNGGQGSARNLGLSVFNGDYVTFIDSDDWVDSKLLYVLLSNAIRTNADISCCSVYSDENGSDRKRDSELIVKNNTEAMNAFVRNEGCFNHSPVGKLFARDTVKGMRFVELSGFEDAGSIFKAFIKADTVVSQNISLYFYYQRKDSTMHRAFSEKDFDRVRAYREMETGLLQHEKYRDATNIVTESKIGAIYYVAGEAMRTNHSHKKQLLKQCLNEAKNTLRLDNGISIRNKVLLTCLIFNSKFFGMLYKIKH